MYHRFVKNLPGNEFQIKMQDGPILDGVVNGCSPTELLFFVRDKLIKFNETYPHWDNSIAIVKLEEALFWLNKRILGDYFNVNDSAGLIAISAISSQVAVNPK